MCPITHLENWFPVDDVTKNCQKRREVQHVILNLMEEQGRTLPPGVSLPTIKFTQNVPLSATRQCRVNNQNNKNSHDDETYYDEHDESLDEDIDNDEDEEAYFEEVLENNRVYNYNNYFDCLIITKCQNLNLFKQREYYTEMGQSEDWLDDEHQHEDEDEDFHSE